MERYDSLIFDLDGTLWNANESCTIAWNEVFEQMGSEKKITIEEMNSVTGKPMDEIIKVLLAGEDHDHSELFRMLDRKEEELVGRYGTFLYPGVSEEIGRLSGTYRLFIVSNCQEWYLHRFLEYAGIGKYISGWDCHGKSGMEKHMMISLIRERHNLKNPVYIGDTVLDYDSSIRSGTGFIQVTYGFGKPIEGVTSFGSFRDLCGHLFSCSC